MTVQPQIRRRDLLGVIGTAVTIAAVPVRAQPSSMPVVAFLSDGTPEGFAPRLDGVRKGLADLGFVEGRNLAVETRWARGDYAVLGNLAAELVRRRVSLIVTAGTERVTRAAKAATSVIPIVATMAGDPVKRGLVESINHPGGNMTVVSLFTSSNNALVAKRVEMLHALVPTARTLGWLVDSNILDYDDQLRDLRTAAQAFGLAVSIAQVRQQSEIETDFKALVQDGAGALLEAGPVLYSNRERVIGLAARDRIPILYEWRTFVDEGGLLSYGSDIIAVYHQAGVYAARILKGERAGDLPVVQQSKFLLVINLKTAKTQGVSVPPNLLALADDVIE